MESEVVTTAVVPYVPQRPSGLKTETIITANSKNGVEKKEQRAMMVAGYKTDALLEYLSQPSNAIRDVSLDELARLVDGRVSESGRNDMKRRIIKAYHDFRKLGYLLLRRYSLAGSVVAVKLFDEASDNDKLFVKEQLEEMQERQLDSRESLDEAAKLAGIALQWDLPLEA